MPGREMQAKEALMSWVRSLLVAGLVGAGVSLSGSALAGVVVASSGPSASQFPTGRKLADNDRITLQQGDSITVIDSRGTRVLRGPGRVAVSQPGRALPNPAFAVLTRKDAAGRARTGAVRAGEGGEPMSPNLWLADLSRPGTQCVVAPEALRAWRPDAAKAARYRISSPAGATGMMQFAADDPIAAWDVIKAPVADGSSYTLTREGGGTVGSFTFVIMDDPPADAEGLAMALIDRGCMGQLELLSRTLATARF